jgi:PBP1b-binding outer membrane lipoprotein LpoB
MKRIALIAILPALLTVGCASSKSTSYSVTPDVSVTVKDTRKKARSPYVQQKSVTPPVAGAAGGSTR